MRALVLLALLALCQAYPPDGGERMSWYHQRVGGSRPASREEGAFFVRNNGQVGLFGGFQERNAINLGPNVYFNDFHVLDIETNSSCTEELGCANEFYTWKRINNGTGAPERRAIFCSAYDPVNDDLILFGGVNYTNTFSSLNFFNDTWRFDFDTNTWTRLFPAGGTPTGLAGMGCDYVNGAIYLFGGSTLLPGTFVSVASDEHWKYDIATNRWDLIGSRSEGVTPPSRPYPGERIQMTYRSIPGTDLIFMTAGFREDAQGVSVPYRDVWIYDASANAWVELAHTNSPNITREYLGSVVLSQRYVLFQGGDAQTQTAAQICKPPLICFIADSPTDDTFIYDIFEQRWTRIVLDHTLQPLKRAALVLTRQNVVLLFGGHNFDGNNGIGDMRDRHLWGLLPRPKYLSDWRSPAAPITPQQYCAQRSFPAGTQGYFCAADGMSFYQCLDGQFASQSSRQNCPAGTTCHCFEGIECSAQGSPCR